MHKQKGFSLLEVLITLVIISFGLLGIAGVIVNSLKNNQSSYSRTQASLLANDMIDRMRANRATASATPSPYTLLMSDAPSGTSVASTDLTQWRTSLAAAMPSGTGSVALNAATRTVTVTVQWDDSRASGDGASVGSATQQIQVQTLL